MLFLAESAAVKASSSIDATTASRRSAAHILKCGRPTMGQFIGALLGTLMVSRLFLWLSKKMGDTVTRIVVADLATLGFAVFVGAYGFARMNEGPQFALAAEIYALPSLIWLVVDLVALRGRRVAKPVDATTERPPTTN